jgi:hypothetical protein
MKKYLLLLAALLGLSLNAQAATSTASPVILPTVLTTSSNTAVGTLFNLIVASPTANVGAYSSGYYNYLTYVHLEMYASSALTGGATPTFCTFSNWPGSPKLMMPSALAVGVNYIVDLPMPSPASATAASQVMLSCPATANVIWNGFIQYYQNQ